MNGRLFRFIFINLCFIATIFANDMNIDWPKNTDKETDDGMLTSVYIGKTTSKDDIYGFSVYAYGSTKLTKLSVSSIKYDDGFKDTFFWRFGDSIIDDKLFFGIGPGALRHKSYTLNKSKTRFIGVGALDYIIYDGVKNNIIGEIEYASPFKKDDKGVLSCKLTAYTKIAFMTGVGYSKDWQRDKDYAFAFLGFWF